MGSGTPLSCKGDCSLPSASAGMLPNWQMSPDLACDSEGSGPLPAVLRASSCTHREQPDPAGGLP